MVLWKPCITGKFNLEKKLFKFRRDAISVDKSIKIQNPVPSGQHIGRKRIVNYGKHIMQIHIQFVFAVKYRNGLIQESIKNELFQYISGIIKANNHKLLAINWMPDHIHILIGMRLTQSISELIQVVKANSSKWINDKKFLNVKFD